MEGRPYQINGTSAMATRTYSDNNAVVADFTVDNMEHSNAGYGSLYLYPPRPPGAGAPSGGAQALVFSEHGGVKNALHRSLMEQAFATFHNPMHGEVR